MPREVNSDIRTSAQINSPLPPCLNRIKKKKALVSIAVTCFFYWTLQFSRWLSLGGAHPEIHLLLFPFAFPTGVYFGNLLRNNSHTIKLTPIECNSFLVNSLGGQPLL